MLPLLLLLALNGAPDAAPATAKAGPPAPTEHLRKIVVQAIRNCPEPTSPDEIVVCSRDRGYAEGYRLPKLDPRYADAKAERGDVTAGAGVSGIGSCSASGAGGAAGCTRAMIDSWSAERAQRRAAERLIP